MSQNSNNNTEIKKAHAINMKCYKIIRKPYLFLEDWGWSDVKNGGSLRVTRWVWERFEMGKTMNSQKCFRENWKCLKTDLFAQNTRFSRLSQVVSKSPRPDAKTLKKKILKNLSKCFSRLEVLPTRESRGEPQKSLSPLVTEPSTREQVARLSHEKH